MGDSSQLSFVEFCLQFLIKWFLNSVTNCGNCTFFWMALSFWTTGDLYFRQGKVSFIIAIKFMAVNVKRMLNFLF